MQRILFVLLMAGLGLTRGAAGQQVQFPETPQGRLAAGFFTAVNAPDEAALAQFQESFFSQGALRRRSRDERAALNRSLREQAGRLTPVEIRSASAQQIVVAAHASSMPGVTLTVTFAFTGSPPKIERVDVRDTP